MDTSRHSQVQDLFFAVVDLSEQEREGVLSARYADDPELVAEVRNLLEHSSDVQEDYLSPIAERLRAPMQSALSKGQRFGRYEIERLIGEGGMGAVYEAHQEDPRRQVAIKVLRPGLVTDTMVRRFQHEATVLGLLQHVGIAHIYEAGFEDGQPFFAMEFIRGVSLVDFAAKLEVRDILKLFASVCDAVHHAHTKGVVHRDLKPANILVDEAGQPKVLDFGVARSIDADLHEVTRVTGTGEFLGTLPYMSPEQAGGTDDDVDTRTDVYALGAILYQLLTGEIPLQIRDRSLMEAVRIIVDEEPTRLGTFDTTFRGDIEVIVQKSMAKERDRRYASAAELATDLRRHLINQPILARPASSMYQLTKFARRNRALVIGFVLVVLSLASGLIAFYWQAKEAKFQAGEAFTAKQDAIAQKDLAEDRLEEADATLAFLIETLNTVNPYDLGREATVLDALNAASEKVETRWQDFPAIEARIRLTLGIAFSNRGHYEIAAHHLRRAYELRVQTSDEDDFVVLESAYELGRCLIQVSVFHREESALEEAESLFARTLQIQREILEADDAKTIDTVRHLVSVLTSMKRLDEAWALCSEFLPIASAAFGHDAPPTVRLRCISAMTLMELNRHGEVGELIAEGIDQIADLLGKPHESTGEEIFALEYYYREFGNPREWLSVLEQGIELRRQLIGDRHPLTLELRNKRLELLMYLGSNQEAHREAEELVEAFTEVLGEDSDFVMRSRFFLLDLGDTLGGDDGALVDDLWDLVADSRDALGEGNTVQLMCLGFLGAVNYRNEQYDESEADCREALELVEEFEHIQLRFNYIRHTLGMTLIETERFEEAIEEFLQSYEVTVAARGPTSKGAQDAARWLARCYRALGDEEEADRYEALSNSQQN